MTFDDEPSRYSAKRDRLARLIRVVTVLRGHPDGIKPGEIARRIDVSPRTVYRDLRAIDEEIGVAVWSDGGRWGVVGEGFLPALKLTLSEAMAVVLSARLMVRYADKYDPDLAAAFEKLSVGLPPALAEYVEGTLDVMTMAPRDPAFAANVRLLTKAWAERRVVTIAYRPARYESGARPRRATVRPYLIEPSLQTHALYLIGFDEERAAIRTFKIERIESAALTPRTFDAPDPAATTAELRRAWDIIADQPATDVVLRFTSAVAARVSETVWHPTQAVANEPDGSLRWRATVAGTIEIRLWILSWGDDVEVLEPPGLRADVAMTHERAALRYHP